MMGNISYRFIYVWQRNFAVYRKVWKISFLTPILQPFLYILAFGVGLGVLVGEMSYQGRVVSYTSFIAPSLIAITMMQSSFFETTYASFVRMYYQKTFDAMMATPLSLEEIIIGEIAWGATKSLLATVLMTAVISLFGYISYPEGLLLAPLALLGGLAFGGVGMYFTSITPHIETFNLPIFLFITPMFLFSGTFFPLENLPEWVQVAAEFLPLTHIVALTRSFAFGMLDARQLWSVLYLVILAVVFVPVSVVKMKARLVK